MLSRPCVQLCSVHTPQLHVCLICIPLASVEGTTQKVLWACTKNISSHARIPDLIALLCSHLLDRGCIIHARTIHERNPLPPHQAIFSSARSVLSSSLHSRVNCAKHLSNLVLPPDAETPLEGGRFERYFKNLNRR